MSLLQEFKSFAMKGNVIDLAVGVVIGSAFSKIVSSLVENIITPLIGIIMMGANFAELSFGLGNAKIKYGMFIQSVLDFLIVAIVLFLVMKGIQKTQELKKKKENTLPEPTIQSLTKDQELLEEIRDLLKKRK